MRWLKGNVRIDSLALEQTPALPIRGLGTLQCILPVGKRAGLKLETWQAPHVSRLMLAGWWWEDVRFTLVFISAIKTLKWRAASAFAETKPMLSARIIPPLTNALDQRFPNFTKPGLFTNQQDMLRNVNCLSGFCNLLLISKIVTSA